MADTVYTSLSQLGAGPPGPTESIDDWSKRVLGMPAAMAQQVVPNIGALFGQAQAQQQQQQATAGQAPPGGQTPAPWQGLWPGGGIGTAQLTGQTPQSYFNPVTAAQGMPVGNYGLAPSNVVHGGTGAPGTSTGASTMATQPGQTTSTTVKAIPPAAATIPQWTAWYKANLGKTILVAGQLRTISEGDLNLPHLINQARSNNLTLGKYTAPGGQTAPPPPSYFGQGATAPPPETTALQQMSQIDPASEALRQQLAGSYATPLSQAQAPSAANLQSYLDIYKQLDPTSYAAMQTLGQQVGGNLALGSTLDPTTQMQIQQAVRAGQGARGNVYGTPQLTEEAMTTGQAGLALQAQRQQAAQSYLQSGITPGSVGLNMYQQNLNNLRAAQAGAQSYLGSGQTPYQAGAGYLANAQNMANMSSQGFSMGQPAGLAPSYSYLNPAYGQQTAQTALGYYNQMGNLYNTQMAYGQQQGGSPLAGAAGGALSGAAAGTALMPGWGTAIGAIAGGLMGGLSA